MRLTPSQRADRRRLLGPEARPRRRRRRSRPRPPRPRRPRRSAARSARCTACGRATTGCGTGVGERVAGRGGDRRAPASRAAAASSLRRDEDGAWSSSSSARPNGPLPTGAMANSLVAMSANGISPRRWAGRSGWVAAARKPPIGVARRNVTVLSSSAAASTSAHEPEPAARGVGVLERRDRVQDVGGGDRLRRPATPRRRGCGTSSVLPSSDSLSRTRRGPARGCSGAHPHEPAEHEADERALGAVARRRAA